MLTTYRVADVFDCFTNFPSGFAEAFFYFTTCVINPALRLEFLVVESSAESFFSSAFNLIPFAFNFIPVW
jgi:hypothetical protein